VTWLDVLVALPWVVAAAGCYAGYQILQQNNRLVLRLEALEDLVDDMGVVNQGNVQAGASPDSLPMDSPAPAFELPDLEGVPVSLEQLRGRQTALIFFSPQCNYCVHMAPFLAQLPADGRAGGPVPVVLTRGDLEENRRLARQHGLRCTVLFDADGKVAAEYGTRGTPMGYLIDEEGRIASGLVAGAGKVLRLADPAYLTEGHSNGAAAFLGMPQRFSSDN
jgi:peroxiredoxin Q/BCP